MKKSLYYLCYFSLVILLFSCSKESLNTAESSFTKIEVIENYVLTIAQENLSPDQLEQSLHTLSNEAARVDYMNSMSEEETTNDQSVQLRSCGSWSSYFRTSRVCRDSWGNYNGDLHFRYRYCGPPCCGGYEIQYACLWTI